MTPAEKNLESLITAATHALAMCPDPLLVKAQKALIALRTPAMVAEMERKQGLASRGPRPFHVGRAGR